jgi:hypothetical protein
LAYVELHGADSAQAAAATLRRAIGWFAEQGCGPVEAVMTDNALIYRRSRAFAAALADHHARHILIPPFTPRWNGKVCVLAWRCRPSGRRGSPRPVV